VTNPGRGLLHSRLPLGPNVFIAAGDHPNRVRLRSVRDLPIVSHRGDSHLCRGRSRSGGTRIDGSKRGAAVPGARAVRLPTPVGSSGRSSGCGAGGRVRRRRLMSWFGGQGELAHRKFRFDFAFFGMVRQAGRFLSWSWLSFFFGLPRGAFKKRGGEAFSSGSPRGWGRKGEWRVNAVSCHDR